MFNSEKIFANQDKFEIYPSHKGVYNSILKNIRVEKKLIIRGEQLSGKSFFCRKLVENIKNNLRIPEDRIKFYDLPIVILKNIRDIDSSVISFDMISSFVENNDLNKILNIENFDLIVLDDINDLIFADALKFDYILNENQILIQLIEDNLYYTNKKEIQKKKYSIYQLSFPTLKEIEKSINRYLELFKNCSLAVENLTKDKFKSLIT